MPPRRELPGFYFDETKNRYFPLSSKPKAAPASLAPALTNNAAKRRRLDSDSEPDQTQSSSNSEESRRGCFIEDGHVRTWRAIRDIQTTSSSRQRSRACRSVGFCWLWLEISDFILIYSGFLFLFLFLPFAETSIDHRWRPRRLVKCIACTPSQKVPSQRTKQVESFVSSLSHPDAPFFVSLAALY